MQEADEKTIFWKKNSFMLPNGAAGKSYITGGTKLMNGWVNNLPLKNITFKVIRVMLSLLPQKPSKTSTLKDHIKAL